MRIVCPHCGFFREVADSQVPDRPVKVTCPKCQQGFSFDKNAAPPAPQGEPFTKPATDSAGLAVHSEGRTVCPACGLEQPDDESCIGCGVVYAKWAARQERTTTLPPSGAAPSLPTATAFTAMPSPADLPKAGFWIRVVASLIDGLILGVVQFVIGLVLGFAGGAAGGESMALFAVTWLCSVVVSVTYYVFFTGYNGQTPGKMALRLQVIRTDGTPVGYGKAFLREVPCKFISGILLGIGYLMVAFDVQKQGLHDRMAGTYVVKL
jgi:predicted Zn finger-like uncharacterized protein